MKQEKAKLDIINFAYGIGAAIVIIAAMFKFLGWDYSNEFFIIGLTTEAVVFIISAFEYKTKEKDYKWENIFPEITQEVANPKMSLSMLGEANAASTESLMRSIESFDVAIQRLNKTTEGLASSAENIKSQVIKTEKTSSDYATELASFKENLNSFSLGKSLETFDATIKRLNTATESLAISTEAVQSQLKNSEKSSVGYSAEMAELKENLNKVNMFYKEMLQVMGKKAN